jgi:hypothetical protein
MLPSMNENDKADQEAHVVEAATDTSLDRQRALNWFQSEPIAEFGNLTAKALVADGKADSVIKYLGSIKGGSSG